MYNGHGDVTGFVDYFGKAGANYTYDAFGNQTSSTEEVYNPFRYCGEYFDEESGLIYLRNRYYDPSIGAFISEDPYWNPSNMIYGDSNIGIPNINAIMQSGNLYVYCMNNPVMFIDPLGFITEEEQEMYENGQMAPMAYTYLMRLTYEWYLADSQEYKDYVHQLAENFRSNNYKTTKGTNQEVDDGIAFMPKKPSENLNEEQHYFRNRLNIEYTYHDFKKLNERLPDNLKWTNNVASDLHQNTALSSGPNEKYVSACGHFEIVYNANGDILNNITAPEDMGTYNYCNPTTDPIGHYLYDVYPYKSFGWFGWGYGNVKE